MAAQAEASVRLSLVDRISAPIRRIQARMAAMSRGLGIDRIAASFDNLTKRIGGLGGALSATSGRFATLAGLAGLGAGGLATALYSVTKGAADAGGEIEDTAYKLGIGAEALQEYRYAAKLSGLEAETFSNGVQKLGLNASAAASGNKGMAATFKSLGVTLKDSNGKLRSTEEILNDTFAGLARIEDPMRRNEMAFKTFGKSGVDFVKMLMDGEEGLVAFREEARRTGHVMSADAAAMGGVFGDNVDRLMTRLEGLKLFLGVQLMPVMDDLVTTVTEWVSANQGLVRSTITEWVGRLAGLFKDLMDPTSEIRVGFTGMAESVGNLASTFTPLVNALGVGNTALLALGLYIGGPLIAAFASLIPAVWALGVAIMTTPIGWIIGGIALLLGSIYLLATNWDAVVEAWNAAWARIVQAWSNFGASIMVAWEGYMAWGRGIAAAIAGWFEGIDLGAIGFNMLGGYFNAVTGFWSTVAGWGAALAAEVAGWLNIDLRAVGEAIVQTLLTGLQAAWSTVTGWFDGAVNGLINAIPEWARGPLGIQVSGQPMTEGDIANRARQEGQSAADKVPGAGWFDSQEAKDAADTAKNRAYEEAQAAAFARLRAENANLTGLGANLTAPAANLAAPSAVPVETSTVTAGAVTTEALNIPEPLVVNEPKLVDNSVHTGPINITVPPGTSAAAAQAMIVNALNRQATTRRDDDGSALND